MRPTDTQTKNPDQQPRWKHGTDLRDDATGIYKWPHTSMCEDPLKEQTIYPSVTTVLDEFMGSGMRHAEHWFTAEYVTQLAEVAREKGTVDVWLATDNVDGGEVVPVKAIDLLLNRLPEQGFGKNFGKHWIKKAGPREMRRRANRGSVLHDALEEWAYGIKVASNEVTDYTQGLLQTRGFALPVDYCDQFVRQLLLWCERHVVEIYMAEAVVMNDTYGYAGTLDTCLTLRGFSELDAIGKRGMVDAKGSKADQPSHELQGAAYFYAEHIGIPDTAERVPMLDLDWMANLYVQEDKCTLRYWPRVCRATDPQDCVPFRAFLHARVLWEALYSDQHPKTVRGETVRRVKPEDAGLPGKLADQVAQGQLQLMQGGSQP